MEALDYSYRDRDSISFVTFVSFLLHLMAFLFFYFYGSLNLFSSMTTAKKYTVIQSAVRVDVVEMPKMTLKELKVVELNKGGAVAEEIAPEPVAKKVAQPPVAESDVKFLKKKKKKNFLSMLKEIGKKKVDTKRKNKGKKKRAKGNGLGAVAESELNKMIFAGNKLSKGSAIVGTLGESETGDFADFSLQLPDIVRPHWNLPAYLKNNEELQCRIQIFLSKNGEVIKASIIESSGNNDYDAKALEAIKRASPFPYVPSSIIKRVLAGEIVLGFPL